MPVEVTPSGLTITSTGYVAVPSNSAERRSFTAASTPSSQMLDPLLSAGFSVVDVLDIARADDGGGRRATAEAPSLEIDVPLAPDQSAALLIEGEDGLLVWKVGDAQDESVTRRALAPGGQSFSIAPVEREGPGRRGPFGDWIIDTAVEPIRVHVLRFLVARTIDAAVAWIEGDMATGPVVITDADPATWRVGPLGPAAEKLAQVGGRPACVLLLVHGTFSTTLGSFGAFHDDFVLSALASYDLIISYDHRTLAEEPADNAGQILQMLHALDLPRGSRIDAIAYSRGGLVLRSLIEQLAPQSSLAATFGKAVFVGCTNAGTYLAEPRNWKALLDLYTNILVAGATLIGLAAGGGVGRRVAVEVIKTLGRFAQMLSQVAVTDRRVPGLAAMEPGSPLVSALNATAAPPPGDTRYFAVTSAFEPGDSGALSKRAALLLADGVADRLFGQANDLVVHTASMTDFGAARKAEAATALDLATHVYHTIYFSSSETGRAIAAWLDLPPPEAPRSGVEPAPQPAHRGPWQERGEWISAEGEPAGRDWARDDLDRPQRRGSRAEPDPSFDARYLFEPPPRGGMAGIDWDSPLEIASDRDTPLEIAGIWSPTAGADLADASPPVAAEPTTERHIAAEMLPFPELGTPVNIYVTVSPEPIVVADHGAADATDEAVPLRVAKPLKLRLIPRSNCEVVGPDEHEVDLHASESVIHAFAVRGLAAGSTALSIEASQGASVVAAFHLAPVFVAKAAEQLRAVQTLVSPAPAKGQAVLRIYEFNMGNGGVRLQFNLTSDDPEFADLQTLTIDGGFSLDAYAAGVLKDVENAWNLRQAGNETALYDSFLERLTADAKQRTRALIPEPVRRSLWKYRDKIREIRVISSEPHIPWELMYLSDPDGQDRKGQGFLAEWGLVRWLHDAPLRRRRIPAASGTKYYVVPDYEQRMALQGAAQEKAMLAARFPDITAVDPSSRSVRRFLSEGSANCALLHFACHGRTQQNSVIASELLMKALTNARGEKVDDPFTWQDVSENADFGPDGGPLVFVNACQTGQTGNGIAGAAGFANAFLRPASRRGAAAFIGALWSVDDKLANRFAEAVYAELTKEGGNLIEAVRTARETCKTKNDFTWLAYSVYTAV